MFYIIYHVHLIWKYIRAKKTLFGFEMEAIQLQTKDENEILFYLLNDHDV